jgi:imidazolonepropionase-like amidohydrolase
LTGILRRAGVPLLAGTDAPEPFVPPGLSMHQELELLVDSGLSPAEALRCATLHNATALGQADRLGTVERGKLADLVLLDANPLDSIAHTRDREGVPRRPGPRPTRPAEGRAEGLIGRPRRNWPARRAEAVTARGS